MKIIGKTAAIVTKSVKNAPSQTKHLGALSVSKVKTTSTQFTDQVKQGWFEVMNEDVTDIGIKRP